MAKVYICDACASIAFDPCRIAMKEFRVVVDLDYFGDTPTKRKKKRKIHLCHDCFRALNEIAKEKADNE